MTSARPLNILFTEHAQGYFDEDYLVAIAQSEGFAYFYTTDPFGRNTQHTSNTHIYRFHARTKHHHQKYLGYRLYALHLPAPGSGG